MKATHLALVTFNDSTHSAIFNIAIEDGEIFVLTSLGLKWEKFKYQSNFLTVSIVRSGNREELVKQGWD